jgi:16S rRNA (cytosine967-C5)-methyltransferase
MSVSPARAAAFDVLLRVAAEGAYASELLNSGKLGDLSAADRGLATELVMGTLRWQSRLDDQIQRASARKMPTLDPEVVIALRMATYQLSFLERVPARAAVHESVELVKRARKTSAATFVNAVLRKLTGQGQKAGALSDISASVDAASVAARSAHPRWLVERWTLAYGLQAAKAICAHDQVTPIAAVRLRDASAEDELRKQGVELAPAALLRSARRVVSGTVATTKPFAEGRVSLQDEASQLVACLVGPGKRILDCCAAPGGKTMVLAERNPEAEIVALELHPHRARLLRERVKAANVEVVTGDVASLPRGQGFDCVLADVPCSGTGTLGRHPEIKWKLQPEDLRDLQRRQLAILQAAMAQVETGGRLVYSTCSLEKEENSDVVEHALTQQPGLRLAECRSVLSELGNELAYSDLNALIDGPYLRILPGVVPGDGFFAAVMQKT